MNPPPISDAVHSAGPFRVAERDVVVRTSCVDFAALVSEVFVDLRRGPGDAPSTSTIEFLVVAVAEPEPHWAIWRDGEACELELREDAVLVQLQWELNRLVIERYRAVVHSGAVAIAEWPTTPEPPVRFTTLIGWPSSFSSRLPMIRAVASVPPPAPQGTISVIGRFG